MATTVYVHTGTPKSGTTSVQEFLGSNKEALAGAGLLFPGKDWTSQVLASRQMVAFDRRLAATTPAWRALAEECAGFDGSAVISMEFLAVLGNRGMKRLVSSLSPARVEVVITMRDLGRTIPAQWQESVQNRSSWSWAEFLEGVTAPSPYDTPAGSHFWRQQGIGRQLDVLREFLPADQVHVVTLPPPGADPGLLLERFASVIGIDLEQFRTDSGRRNESLGLESALVMQRVNQDVAGLGLGQYHTHVKHLLAKKILASRRSAESALVVPERLHPWVAEQARAMVAEIEAAGVHVVGDLADLEPFHRPDGIQPEDVDTEVVLDAAIQGLSGMIKARSSMQRRLRHRIHELGGEPAPRPRPLERLRRRAQSAMSRS